ncbi:MULTISPECIES: hypothetical protein [unclassified Mesorhizobium]|uniref:hypothetical protein n=1 Tax=unclassified Mesorhizobium TaxID=325217 RepID=UPI00167A0078|nr:MULTISPECIES: hypothetical protein [unclassified Mesorhizobium]
MTQTAWLHIGILLLAFVGVVAFVLRRMVLPAPKDGAQGETVAGASGGYGGGSVDGGGH